MRIQMDQVLSFTYLLFLP